MFTLKIPNPFLEGRNCVYLIPSDPPTLVDTGVATERAFDALTAGLNEHNCSIRDIGRIILTHKHIDHIGNAWRIQKESGAEILIHESEVQAVSDVDPDGGRFRAVAQERLDEWQAPADAIARVESSASLRWEIEAAEAGGLVDGQRIELGCGELEVIHTPGHTRGSICLRYGRRLLTGDHVLPDVSPNIGGGDLRCRGLLQHFFSSLKRTSELAAIVDESLPGHGEPFDNLVERCRQLEEHHQRRLDETVEILKQAGPQSVHGLAKQLFGEMRDFHVVLGCAEAHAHLEFLIEQGRVAHDRGQFSLTREA